MDEFEDGYCDICHKKGQITRDYYYYDINCECCGGDLHFEIVRHCQNCKPKPPKRISAIVKPIESS